MTPSVSEAQTVQWSRYTGHNDSRNHGSGYGTVNTGGAAIKRASDGSIYVLQNNSYNSGVPLNLPTTNFSTFGLASVTSPAARMDALISQVGSVWGEAYHQTQKHIYFGTFLKRHVGMADRPGYIYNFDYSGTTPSYTGKFNLQGATPNNGGATIDLGTVCRSDLELVCNT